MSMKNNVNPRKNLVERLRELSKDKNYLSYNQFLEL